MNNKDDQPKKKPPKLQRDANGKLIIKYESRLLKTKKHDAEWRAKKLAQYEKQHQDHLASGKGSMLGYFSPARSASAGDVFVETSKQAARNARGKGPQLRGGQKRSKVLAGTFGRFATNASGDPYLSPSQIRAAWLKAQKAKRIQPTAFAAGKKKSTLVTDTFSRPRFLSNVDGDEDVADLKRKIKNAKDAMSKPVGKFQNFKPPQFTTAPIKKGGPGVTGVLLPVYAEPGDDKLKRINQYVESPYDAAREAEKERKRAAEEKLKQVHGDGAKAFSGRVSSKGVPTFSKDKEIYGEDKETIAMVKAKLVKEAQARERAKQNEDEEPPPQWRPSSPPKRMMYVDKKAVFGGSETKYEPDPVPEYQAGYHIKPKPEEGEERPELAAWVPNGSHSHGYKGTTSVILNKAQLRHHIYKSSGGVSSRSTARTSRGP